MIKIDRRFHIIMGSLVLLLLGLAFYIDYPEFVGLNGAKTHFQNISFDPIIMYTYGGFMLVMGLLMWFTVRSQSKYIKTIKPGDKVLYNGEPAVVKSIDPDNSNRVILEGIEVNATQLSENDYDEE